jgi:hypothetical protein
MTNGTGMEFTPLSQATFSTDLPEFIKTENKADKDLSIGRTERNTAVSFSIIIFTDLEQFLAQTETFSTREDLNSVFSRVNPITTLFNS